MFRRMKRVLVLGFVVFTAACGGSNKTFESLCATEVPPPIACNTACNPAPGAVNDCAEGFHCSADGKCDLQCRLGGTECGEGWYCDTEGYCNKGEDPGGGGDPPIDENCPAVSFQPVRKIPSIQLVVDRSSSMLQNFANRWPRETNGGPPYKYPEMIESLVGNNGVVTQVAPSVYMGATLYTTKETFTGTDCLEVHTVGRKLDNRTAIANELNARPPRPENNAGFTPTAAAIDAAVADFRANPPPPDSPPAIVLVTDGLPNQCSATGSTEALAETAARNAFSAGIKLYILAISLRSNGGHIQRMANAGQGVPAGQNARAFFGDNPAELATEFQALIRGVVSCDLQIDRQIDVTQAESGVVTLNGERLEYGTEWTLNADGKTFTILGARCEQLKAAANPSVEATFACGAVIL